MRILRGLSSRFLPCGCLLGIYETYDSETIAVVDARSESCVHPAHRRGQVVPPDTDAGAPRASRHQPGSDVR